MSRDIEVRDYLRSINPFGRDDGAEATAYAFASCLMVPEAGNVLFVRWLVENNRGFVILGVKSGPTAIFTDKRNGDAFREAGGVFTPIALPTFALARDGGDRDDG